ncbi:MAG: hypothetical protein IJB99_05135, partial [Clostridia bacterium]|nr:hypothetical protein [Clostridia bacterium]
MISLSSDHQQTSGSAFLMTLALPPGELSAQLTERATHTPIFHKIKEKAGSTRRQYAREDL